MKSRNGLKKTASFLLISIIIIFSVLSCSDATVGIAAVYPQLVYNYESKTASPTVSLSVYSEVFQGERIQSMTVRNTTSGMSWKVEPVDILNDDTLTRTFVGCSSLAMPGTLSFDNAVYQVIYEDFAGRTTDALFSLKAQEAGSWGNSAVTGPNVQYLLVNTNGNILYTGPYIDCFSSVESVLRDFPDAKYYREFVLNNELNAIYLLPAVVVATENQ